MTLCPHCGQPMPRNVWSQETREAFDAFWDLYPHRVGKKAAVAAFIRALKMASAHDLMAGVRRYILDKPSSVPYCNPTTWLNQQRWLDQPAYVDTTASKTELPPRDGYEIWRVRIRNYLKDGSWPQIAPPLDHCPWQVRAEFEEQLEAKRKASYAKQTDEMFGSDI